MQTVDWTNGGKEYKEDVHALYKAIQAAKRVKDRPSFIRLRAIAWPAPTSRATAPHGSALGEEEVAATKEILGFDPAQTFEVPPAVIEHTRKLRERGASANGATWTSRDTPRSAKKSPARRLLHRMKERQLPEVADDLTFPADEKGIATRKASGAAIQAIAKTVPSCGWLRCTSRSPTTPR